MEDGGLMEGRKLAHLHVGPGLPLAVPLSSSTGEGLWTPSELSCPLGQGLKAPFSLSTHLGGLLFRLPLTWPPGFSGPGDGRASPQMASELQGRGSLSVVPGPPHQAWGPCPLPCPPPP